MIGCLNSRMGEARNPVSLGTMNQMGYLASGVVIRSQNFDISLRRVGQVRASMLIHGENDPGRSGALGRVPFLLYGILLLCFGIVLYLFGVLLVVPRYLFGLNRILLPLDEAIVWYSGIPVLLGIIFALIDLLLLFPGKRLRVPMRYEPAPDAAVTVVLTAYDDEASIGLAVKDFMCHPRVRNVIVVSNNSRDNTLTCAQVAGAIAYDEPSQGYGQCVWRCWSEALKHDDTGLIVLCEGDMTFRAYDIDKLLAYAPHADIVNGTRTVEMLRALNTQFSTFMYYGNLFVGKLLEAKHLGKATITDVGTTYKLCRRAAIERLLPMLDRTVNLEFNAYFLDQALRAGLMVVECPITFHPRVGISKGGNVNDWRALTVGLRMSLGIIFSWSFVRR
jgi:hypothetical protein